MKRNSAIFLEISKAKIRLMGLGPISPYRKILSFVEMPLIPDDEEANIRGIREMVARLGGMGRKAFISLSLPEIDYKTYSLPPMNEGEFKIIIERDLQKNREMENPSSLLGFYEIGEKQEEHLRKKEILAVIGFPDSIKKWSEILIRSGLNPVIMSPVYVLLWNALLLVDDMVGIKGIVYITEGISYFLIVKDGALTFLRRLDVGAPLLRAEDDLVPPDEISSGKEKDKERLFKELHLSLLFFKQQSRGALVERLILSGEVTFLRESLKSLPEDLGLEIDFFEPSKYMDFTSTKTSVNLRVLLPSLAPFLGLFSEEASPKLNLIPKGLIRRRETVLYNFAVGFALIFLILVLWGGYLYLDRALETYKSLYNTGEAILKRLEPVVREIKAVENERAIHQKRVRFLERLRVPDPYWIEVFEKLSMLVPNEMIFTYLNVVNQNGEFLMDIKGEVVSSAPLVLQQAFNSFYNGLKGAPYFSEVRLEPLKIETGEESEAKEGKETNSEPSLTSKKEIKGSDFPKNPRLSFEVHSKITRR